VSGPRSLIGLCVVVVFVVVLGSGCASSRVAANEPGLSWEEPVVVQSAEPVAPELVGSVEELEAVESPDSWGALMAQGGIPATKHTGNLFVGYTTERGGGGFTVGGQYEYRMNEKFGIGGLVDLVFADKNSVVGAAAFYWHPLPKLTVLGAPGFSWSRKDEFITRVGAAWEFELKDGGYALAPAVYVDLFAEDTPIIAGVYLSKKF